MRRFMQLSFALLSCSFGGVQTAHSASDPCARLATPTCRDSASFLVTVGANYVVSNVTPALSSGREIRWARQSAFWNIGRKADWRH